MRTEEETKEIMKELVNSPDFIAAVDRCLDDYKKVKTEEINAVDIAFHMFCSGYLSCLNYMEMKDLKSRQAPHKHESDGLIYPSNPPQNKCKICGEFYN